MGNIYRYPAVKERDTAEIDGFPNFSYHTNYKGRKLILLDKGINPIARVMLKNEERIPAILISSSPHKVGSDETPWQDYFNAERGYIRYSGDNKDAKTKPESRWGNRALLKQYQLHNSSDSSERSLAAPIIFFKRVPQNNKVKGFLEFNGFGVITDVELKVQFNRKKNEEFVNYLFQFAVLDMTQENETFDWRWINERRNEKVSLNKSLELAPASWKHWLKEGNQGISNLRRNVSKVEILTKEEQIPEKGSRQEKILKEIYNFYSKEFKNKKRFEKLAAIAAEHIITKKGSGSYKPGWVTKGSGDSGIDFVGRLDLGEGFGTAKIIVLGQAKCEKLNSPTGGNHIARTVAKLKRGWIGVYVTTSYFSKSVQLEILDDKYPLLLVNGIILSNAVLQIMDEKGFKDIKTFLAEADSRYKAVDKMPEDILFD